MPTGAILKCMMKRYNSAMVLVEDRSDTLLFKEDATHFHQTRKITCDKHNPILSKYKNNVTVIFWNAHRNEARRVGGLFLIIAKQTKSSLYRIGLTVRSRDSSSSGMFQ
jgi:coproporphyrinogen III oxidase